MENHKYVVFNGEVVFCEDETMQELSLGNGQAIDESTFWQVIRINANIGMAACKAKMILNEGPAIDQNAMGPVLRQLPLLSDKELMTLETTITSMLMQRGVIDKETAADNSAFDQLAEMMKSGNYSAGPISDESTKILVSGIEVHSGPAHKTVFTIELFM